MCWNAWAAAHALLHTACYPRGAPLDTQRRNPLNARSYEVGYGVLVLFGVSLMHVGKKGEATPLPRQRSHLKSVANLQKQLNGRVSRTLGVEGPTFITQRNKKRVL